MKRKVATRILLFGPLAVTMALYLLGQRDLSFGRDREILEADGSRRQVADREAVDSKNAPTGTWLLARNRRIWTDGAVLTASVSRYNYRIDRPLGWYAYLEDNGTGDGKLISPYLNLNRLLYRFPPLRPWSSLGYSYVVTDEPARKGVDFSLVVPLWFPAFLTYITIGSGALLRFLMPGRRTRSGSCPNCNYDLRASKDRCPECGHPIPNPNRGAGLR